jgi:Ca2+-binding EF-hand superfamily protein
MKKFLIGAAVLLASAAAIAQVASTPPTAPAAQASRPFADKARTRNEVQAKIAEHFASVDTNRDGVITKAEADAAAQAFTGRWAERSKERRDNRGDRLFERLDTNRDGNITRAEWDASQAQRGQRIAERGHRGPGGKRGSMHAMGGFGGHMFEMADGNKDGRVTLQEAQAAALKHFDMIDANHDGRITPDERMQMHERMRAEYRG